MRTHLNEIALFQASKIVYLHFVGASLSSPPIQKTKKLLAKAQLNPPWKVSDGEPEVSIQDSPRAIERYNAFIEKHLGYLASGDAILLAEAIEALGRQARRSYLRPVEKSC